MSNSVFNSGDVVLLKSGGPKMTVIEDDGDTCECMWFDDKHQKKMDEFPTKLLKLYKPPTISVF